MVNIIKDVEIYNHFNEYDVVLVGTNLYWSMANGVQLKVMLEYPYVYEENMKTKYADANKLGTILECTKEGEPTFCICFITKGHNFRPDLEKDYLSYEALEKSLKLVNIKYKGKRVACSLLGASRFDGNGDKERILEIFNRCLTDVDVTIYDFFQKSRYEEYTEIRSNERKVKKIDRNAYSEMVKERKRRGEEIFKKNGHRRS